MRLADATIVELGGERDFGNSADTSSIYTVRTTIVNPASAKPGSKLPPFTPLEESFVRAITVGRVHSFRYEQAPNLGPLLVRNRHPGQTDSKIYNEVTYGKLEFLGPLLRALALQRAQARDASNLPTQASEPATDLQPRSVQAPTTPASDIPSSPTNDLPWLSRSRTITDGIIMLSAVPSCLCSSALNLFSRSSSGFLSGVSSRILYPFSHRQLPSPLLACLLSVLSAVGTGIQV